MRTSRLVIAALGLALPLLIGTGCHNYNPHAPLDGTFYNKGYADVFDLGEAAYDMIAPPHLWGGITSFYMDLSDTYGQFQNAFGLNMHFLVNSIEAVHWEFDRHILNYDWDDPRKD